MDADYKVTGETGERRVRLENQWPTKILFSRLIYHVVSD